LIQLWVNDSRSLGATVRTETVTSEGNTVTLTYPGTTAGALGQHTIGTFTAKTETQTIKFMGNVSSQVNAMQLRNLGGPESAAPKGRNK
jgi:hypothetical protein